MGASAPYWDTVGIVRAGGVQHALTECRPRLLAMGSLKPGLSGVCLQFRVQGCETLIPNTCLHIALQSRSCCPPSCLLAWCLRATLGNAWCRGGFLSGFPLFFVPTFARGRGATVAKGARSAIPLTAAVGPAAVGGTEPGGMICTVDLGCPHPRVMAWGGDCGCRACTLPSRGISASEWSFA